MSIDLDTHEIISSITVEDEDTGELIEYNFDIEVTEVNGGNLKLFSLILKQVSELM